MQVPHQLEIDGRQEKRIINLKIIGTNKKFN